MGATPVVYGDGLADRLRTAAGGRVDAFIDCFGGGYVDMATEDLGVAADRVDTIIDWAAAEARGAHADGMSTVDDVAQVMAELAALIDGGQLSVPVSATFALADVRLAYTQLEERHSRGKIVLLTGR